MIWQLEKHWTITDDLNTPKNYLLGDMQSSSTILTGLKSPVLSCLCSVQQSTAGWQLLTVNVNDSWEQVNRVTWEEVWRGKGILTRLTKWGQCARAAQVRTLSTSDLALIRKMHVFGFSFLCTLKYCNNLPSGKRLLCKIDLYAHLSIQTFSSFTCYVWIPHVLT